jgi:hypothetical protein
MIYEGDLKLNIDDGGPFDISFPDGIGQPEMTDTLDTMVILAVFGEDTWQNSLADTESGKYKSTFPEVIKRAVVNDETKNNGTEAIKDALQFMIDDGLAKTITVRGEIMSVYGIGWQVDIERPTGETIRGKILWDRGVLQWEGKH